MTTQMIRRLAVVPALVLATAFTAACDDDLTDPNDEIVGEFTATEAVFTDNADVNNEFDVLAEGGTLDMDFRQDGTFSSTLAVPTRDPIVRSGDFEVSGDEIVMTEGNVTRAVTFNRTATGLNIDDPGARFDFDGTGPISSTLTARFQQR